LSYLTTSRVGETTIQGKNIILPLKVNLVRGKNYSSNDIRRENNSFPLTTSSWKKIYWSYFEKAFLYSFFGNGSAFDGIKRKPVYKANKVILTDRTFNNIISPS